MFDFFDSKEVEWSDQSVHIAGVRAKKIQGIDWKPTQNKELLYAEGDEPVGIQRGNKGYSGNMKVLKSIIDAMNIAAIAAGGSSILDLEFDVVVKFRSKESRKLQLTTLVGVQVTEVPEGWEQGATSMQHTLPILYLRQVRI